MANARTPTLNPGERIGVMAPSSFVERADIEKSTAALEARGFEVYIHPQTYARHPTTIGQSAGAAGEKLEAFHNLWADDTIKAIWCAGGGNRALYLTPHLDFKLIASNPKPLIGFSDVTALLNPITARTGLTTFHGQVFKHLHKFDQLDETLGVLSGQTTAMDLSQCKIVKSGSAEGSLVGGCLSLFHYLPGSADCPDLEDAILFLEDTSDHISRFDRMFAQMKRQGVFDKISGLVLGEFIDLQDGERPFGFTIEDIALEAIGGRDIPIVMNAPFGHGKNLLPLPIGKKALLNTTERSIKWP